MHPVIESLIQEQPVLLDGAWGTELQARGLPVGQCSDVWNRTHPQEVEAVARAYAEAGSRIVLTNTFGGNRFTLADAGLAAEVAAINHAGAACSRRGAGAGCRVFGSMGPSGKMLLMGDVSEEDLAEAFRVQAVALAEGGVDGLVVETMADLREATLAVEAAAATGLPVVGCMIYDSGPQRDHTMMGITPEQQAETLLAAGADLVGANCGQGIDGFIPLCARLHAASGRPVWIKANAGLPAMEDGKAVYRTTAADFASRVPALIAAGCGFIGGCCGTSPAFIRAVRTVIGR